MRFIMEKQFIKNKKQKNRTYKIKQLMICKFDYINIKILNFGLKSLNFSLEFVKS